MSQKLEDDFVKSERKRREIEQIKTFVKQDTPLSELATKISEQVQLIKQQFSDIRVVGEIEAKQFLEPMNHLLNVLQQRATFSEELQTFTEQINDVGTTLASIASNVKDASVKMDSVFHELTVDLAERQKLRVKQMETLQKIDTYLEAWR